MENGNKKKISIILIVLIISLLCLISLEKINKETVKKDNLYYLNLENATINDSHTFSLKEGDVLTVSIDVSKGQLELNVIDEKGNNIYEGNGTALKDFKININSEGNYNIYVKGKRITAVIKVETGK